MKFLKALPRNIIIACLVFYTVFGFFILPLILESQLEKAVTENYKEQLQIEKISFNPFTFELQVKNLVIPDTHSGGVDKERLRVGKLLLNFEIFPVFIKKITFKEAQLENTHVYLSFYKNQRNNWSTLTPKGEEEKTEENKSPWTLVLEELSFSQNHFQFRDFNYDQPVNLPLGPLSLKASQITTQIGSESSLEHLFINMGEQGTLLLKGKVGLTPPKVDLHVTAKKFPLSFLTSYLSSSTYLEIPRGSLDINGSLNYDQAVFKINADAVVSKFLLSKSTDQSSILEIEKADFNKLTYSTGPHALSIDSIVFKELNTHILLRPDGTLNFKELTKNVPEENAGKSTDKKSAPMSYNIGKLTFVNGKLDFNDWQIKPKFEANIHELNGDLGPLSSDLENKIDINLTGMVEEQGKFTSKGFFFQAQKPMNLDLGVNFSNIEMTTFTPYSGHFMGYEIKKGKLFLDLNYKLKQNRIVGKNKVRLDHFTLGEKVESKNSTSLPLKLAIALLKDRKGQIKFNLPVEGQTDSPKFSYGSAIRTALFNMIVNIVAAPFDFLADLFGGGKELQLIEFENQTPVFKAANEVKLDTVARMMEERPDLRLEILGTCSEKEFLIEGQDQPPLIEEAKYKEIGLARAQLVQNLLVKRNISAERLYVMAGKKNDDSIGPSGAVLIFKVD